MSSDRLVYVASVSGGKDSTAMALHLREQGIPFRAVFYNTGWEHPDTYRYVAEVLPGAIGQAVEIRSREPVLTERLEGFAVELEGMLGFRSAMVRWVLKRAMFPSRQRRWCTQELKMFTCRDVMREVHASGLAPVNVVGVRAAESRARAKLIERELDEDLDCMVWRPMLRWSIDDVIAIHHRHGVHPNPLYLRNAERVGCWPCIMAGKPELRLLAGDEGRIRVIERLEAIVAVLAAERLAARGEVLDHPPHFFQGHRSDRGEDGKIPTLPIRERVEWAQTDRGGVQMMMPLPDDSGCMRWGLCDLPAGDESGTA